MVPKARKQNRQHSCHVIFCWVIQKTETSKISFYIQENIAPEQIIVSKDF